MTSQGCLTKSCVWSGFWCTQAGKCFERGCCGHRHGHQVAHQRSASRRDTRAVLIRHSRSGNRFWSTSSTSFTLLWIYGPPSERRGSRTRLCDDAGRWRRPLLEVVVVYLVLLERQSTSKGRGYGTVAAIGTLVQQPSWCLCSSHS